MVLNQLKETVAGAIVVLIGVVFLGLVSTRSANRDLPGYDVNAKFNRTDGLRDNAQVRLSGLPVGRVVNQDLDSTFRSVVTMRIDPGINLPKDSSAAIHTDGLLGDKYIEIQPGGEEAMIKPGGSIGFTQDSVVVEDLMDKIVTQAKIKRGHALDDKKAN